MSCCGKKEDEAKTPKPVVVPPTSLSLFLEKNPWLVTIKEMRDGKGGIFKWIDCAIFGWLLFSPALVMIPTMKEPAIIAVLWIIIGLLMFFKIDYAHQGEAWFICLCRGIVLDLPKTDSPKKWLLSRPVVFAIIFLLIYLVVSYIGLDPDLEFSDHEMVLTAVLAVVGLSFVLLLTKSVVCVEGDTGTLSLNMVLFIFADPAFLSDKGFRKVHISQLDAYIRERSDTFGRCADPAKFSWDDIHKLPGEALPTPFCTADLMAGIRLVRFLKPLKDHGDNEKTPTALE